MTALQQFQNFIKQRKIGIFTGMLAGILLAYLINKPIYTFWLMIIGATLGIIVEYLSIKNSNVRNFTSNKVVFVIALILVIFVGMNLFTPTLLESVNIPTMIVPGEKLLNLEISKAFEAGASSVPTAGKLFTFPFTTGAKGIWGFLGNFMALGPVLMGTGTFLLIPPLTPLGVILIIIGAIVTLVTGGTVLAGIWTILSNFKLIMILGFIVVLFIIMAGRGKRK